VRLAEASQLTEGLSDPLLKPALEAFAREQRGSYMSDLLIQIRLPERDTMKEARLAGLIEAYETLMSDLTRFAERSLERATQ
jgi:hypothetical protein